MPLSTGSRLGIYEISGAIGAGGMGEVYRARDTQLNRDVAIKVLPELFAMDSERLARFTREAQTLAALNHPNIAQIYGLDASSGQTRALVMELVAGDDLSVLMARGPIPVSDALPVAAQIAEALEAAHDIGIVHRDLKPANIKVRADGAVKVLDFGLAKAIDPAVASTDDAVRSPTLTARATQMGTIIGTAAYMAPEQAKGKAVDRRADIWSFGVVVYEMLTGRRAFAGDDISDVLASVLRQEIDWTALPEDTPPRVRQLLERCLDRDPKRRLRDIGEARVALTLNGPASAIGAVTSVSVDEGTPSSTRAPNRVATRRGVAIAAVCLAAGAAAGIFAGKRWPANAPPATEQPVRTMIVPTASRTIEDSQAISPDGKRMAYTAGGSLWIRNLAELEPREVKGSQGAERPFWSPRSDAVAYVARGALFKTSADGGAPVELCKITGGDFTGGSWSASQGLVFTASRANWTGEVMHVPENGGTPDLFTQADAGKRERRLSDPHFLPDGRSLFYTVTTFDANDGEIALDTGGVRTLLGLGNGSTHAAWSPTGHVVFTRGTGIDTDLWALPFSLAAMSRTGEPVRIAAGGSAASVSSTGSLLYGLQRPEPHTLVRVDRRGQVVAAIAQKREFLTEPKLSPDGRLAMTTTNYGMVSVWETERGVETRITGDDEPGLHGRWLTTGKTLEILYGRLGNASGTWIRRADGTGTPRRLTTQTALGADVSFDGRYLAYYVVDPQTGRDLWVKEMARPDDGVAILRTPANEARPQISPDGKFVAYQSDISGRWEIYVMPFPAGEGRIRASTDGGQHPAWNPKGGELFYVSGDDVMAVKVTLGPVLQAGRAQRLFGGRDVGTRLSRPRFLESFYDAAPDGQGFIVVKGNGMGTSDVVIGEGLLSNGTIANR